MGGGTVDPEGGYNRGGGGGTGGSSSVVVNTGDSLYDTGWLGSENEKDRELQRQTQGDQLDYDRWETGGQWGHESGLLDTSQNWQSGVARSSSR